MKLYPYQEQYLADLPKNIIMAADVGLGKTIMALEHARLYGVKRLVVIAPASKVRTGDWQREIENFFASFQNVLYGNWTSPQYDVLSYEMFTKRYQEFLSSDVTLIIDESHMACNATTKRAKAILKVALQAHQWIMLSATPLPNGWRSAETYAILTGLSRNKTAFVQRFERIDRSRGFPLLLGYNEQPVLDAWWSKIAKPLKRTGELKLPSENIALYPKMSTQTHATYRRALRDRLYRVDGEDEMLDNPSKLFTKLRQIPVTSRIDALENVLNDTDEHVVVFYNYNTERDAILELLAKKFKDRKTYEQSGHRSELPVRSKWGKLSPSITIVQYQSGSQAIELTYASVTVYLSPCTSYANYEQSKGRTRRNGQAKTTLFYHVSVEETLDRHIWGLLKKKQSFSEAMFSDYIANITT